MKKTDTRTRARFFSGVMALTFGNLFVKLVGLILKIPLHDSLGDAGMTYYNEAYNIYVLLFTLSTTGLPTAISMLISENRVKGNKTEIKKIFRVTMTMLFIIGVVGMSIMLFGAPFFEKAYKLDNLSFCIKAVAPTLFFICVTSSLRGYFQGYQSMVPTAVSEVIEAVGKLVLGLLFATYAAQNGKPLHIIAAYAALGLTIGVAAGMVYLFIAKLLFNPQKYDSEYSEINCENTAIRSAGNIIKAVLMIAIPITVTNSVQSFSTVIDGVVLSRRLQEIGFNQETTKELIGNYRTLVSPLCNLPPALISPITASILPLMRAAITAKNKIRTRNVMNGALLITAIIELPCALGMSALSEPILKLLFGDNGSSEKAAPLLSMLSLSVFFVSVIAITSAFLQAHKLEKKPIISMLIGAVVKIVTIYIFAGIPEINIYASPISSFLGGFVISAINLFIIKKHIGFLPDFGKMMIRPLGASFVCAVSAMFSYKLLSGLLAGSVALLVSISLSAVIYFFLIFLFKALTKEDILLLPKGEKLSFLLKKMHLIK